MQPDLFTAGRIYNDITMSRHRGSIESIAANPSQTAKALSRQKVLDVLSGGSYTAKEIAYALGVPLHCVSGRISELKAAGLVRKTGSRRDGAAVLVRV